MALRATAFVDNSSIFISANQSGYNYDLNKLIATVGDGYALQERRIYGSKIGGTHLEKLDAQELQREVSRQQFFHWRKSEGYTVVVLERVLRGGPMKLRCRSCGHGFALENVPCPSCQGSVELRGNKQFFQEKEVDVAIASDMVFLAKEDAFDVALLFSGDLDFRYAVDLLATCGKRVVNAAFRWGHSGPLRQRCVELGGRYVVLDRLAGPKGVAPVWKRS